MTQSDIELLFIEFNSEGKNIGSHSVCLKSRNNSAQWVAELWHIYFSRLKMWMTFRNGFIAESWKSEVQRSFHGARLLEYS
jgi:hypothetical protein